MPLPPVPHPATGVEDNLGLSFKQVSPWEQGWAEPRPPSTKILCRVFGASAQELGLYDPTGATSDPTLATAWQIDNEDGLPSKPQEKDSAMTAYPASAYIWLKDFERAKVAAEEAVSVHESAPVESRSPSREAIAHIDLGIALAELGSADEAVGQGRLALGSSRVVDSVLSRAGDLNSVLIARYPYLSDARDFGEQYRQMASVAG